MTMPCRDVRELLDSYLSQELLVETNHSVLRHLESCPECRAELDARSHLRTALRRAVRRAPDLQLRPAFAGEVAVRLQQLPAIHEPAVTKPATRWLALAASLLAAVAVGSYYFLAPAPASQLARDAVGDHQNCALRYRLVRAPVPLEEAARQFDSAYRLLLEEPPDNIPTAVGPVRVTERHSCAFGDRRFGHVIMSYRGHVVSMLMTANDRAPAERDAIPHVIGRSMNGLSVVSVNGSRHVILLVSDLDTGRLTELSRGVSVPLMRHVDVSLRPEREDRFGAVRAVVPGVSASRLAGAFGVSQRWGAIPSMIAVSSNTLKEGFCR